MTKSIHCTILCFFFLICLHAQDNTVGLLSYNPHQAYEGYNIIYPHNQPNVYLLNNCGEIVHTWEGEADTRPGNVAELLEDGRLIKAHRPAAVANDPIWAGGGGASVEIVDWDNNQEWSFTRNNDQERLHHDIAPMPNGNILMIVWEKKTREEAIQAGRDTMLIAEDELWPDYILEVNPNNDEIVWEWHAWDHLVQEFDATKDNYGNVADHPERIDLNWDTNSAKADWMHTNAIDYNEVLDQIMISVPTFHEIWIIDHSTTTEQAAGHTGGNSGRGGDLIYRWGNPAAYQAGTEADQQLFYQHDCHWINDFVDVSHPHFGKIAVFNNRVGADFSTANVINPSFDMYKWTYLFNNTYLPNDFDWTLLHPMPTQMHSTGLSSVQMLSNGNTLIEVGRWGYSFEINPNDEIVWEYRTPLVGGNPATQGDILAINNNLTFRIKRYPSDYAAFDNRDLSPKGYLELNPNEDFCATILSVEDYMTDYQLDIFPNPATETVIVEWEAGRMVDVAIYNTLGQSIAQFEASGGRRYLDVSDWHKGMYIVEINQHTVRKLLVQ